MERICKASVKSLCGNRFNRKRVWQPNRSKKSEMNIQRANNTELKYEAKRGGKTFNPNHLSLVTRKEKKKAELGKRNIKSILIKQS